MSNLIRDILRTCKKCGETKPLSDFTISYGCSYNRTHTCKSCHNKIYNSDYKKRIGKKNHVDVERKQCVKCGIEKDINEFHVNLQRKDGHSSVCSKCQSVYIATYKEIPENLERVKKSRKKYYDNNKQKWADFKESEWYCEYRESDHYRELSRTQSRIYYNEHKTECNKKSVKCHLNLRAKDNKVKVRDNIRNHIWRDVKRGKFSVTTAEVMGCTFNEFYKHIESLFLPGMSWDNYGFYGWHVDHITPLSSFDSEDLEQMKIAWNLTNLRPLWAKDNLSKGAKIIAA